jgi:hypothetical protein
LFAYFGGPLVLDALVACLSPHQTPQHVEDASAWFDDALRDAVRTRAATVASVLAIDKHSIMRILKLALRAKHATLANSAQTQMLWAGVREYVEELRRDVESAAAEHGQSGQHKSHSTDTTTEPRAGKRVVRPAGVPERSPGDAGRCDGAQINAETMGHEAAPEALETVNA